MKTLLSYITGFIALIAVSAAVLATIHFIVTHSESGSKLASSVIRGAGSAMGAFIGGALVLRFKSARRFLRRLFTEESD